MSELISERWLPENQSKLKLNLFKKPKPKKKWKKAKLVILTPDYDKDTSQT